MIPSGAKFLDVDEGYWYREDPSGYNYHRDEQEYIKFRPATEDEVIQEKAYRTLYKFALDHKL